jgi:hypothetical protein
MLNKKILKTKKKCERQFSNVHYGKDSLSTAGHLLTGAAAGYLVAGQTTML